MGIPHHNRALVHRGTHAVRDNPVARKVAAANHIAGAGGGNRQAFFGKETAAIAVRHKIRAGFGIGIGIVAVERVVLAVTPAPFTVQVYLVCRDVDDGLHRTFGRAHTFQQVHRAHDVRLIRFRRADIRHAHERLRRQVQDNLRPGFVKRFLQGVPVAHVPGDGVDMPLQACQREKVRIGWRGERIARDVRAGQGKHVAHPGALEPGVAGEEHTLPAVKRKIHGSVLPHFPRSFATFPNFFEHFFFSCIIHALPKPRMTITH